MFIQKVYYLVYKLLEIMKNARRAQNAVYVKKTPGKMGALHRHIAAGVFGDDRMYDVSTGTDKRYDIT